MKENGDPPKERLKEIVETLLAACRTSRRFLSVVPLAGQWAFEAEQRQHQLDAAIKVGEEIYA